MNNTSSTPGNETPASSEAVGLFADRDSFEAAIKALLDAGFDHADLSVLSSHESIDAAGKPGKTWQDVATALVGELKFEVPLVASGAVFMVGGPIAATVAGLIGAAGVGIAAKEVIEGVTSSPHTEDFARSLAAGSVILWVRTSDAEKQDAALAILRETGGQNIHMHQQANQ